MSGCSLIMPSITVKSESGLDSPRLIENFSFILDSPTHESSQRVSSLNFTYIQELLSSPNQFLCRLHLQMSNQFYPRMIIWLICILFRGISRIFNDPSHFLLNTPHIIFDCKLLQRLLFLAARLAAKNTTKWRNCGSWLRL